MPYPTHATDDDAPQAGYAGQMVEQADPQGGRYGVAVRDIFSDATWTPAEPVRARDWHDNGSGATVQSTETTFD